MIGSTKKQLSSMETLQKGNLRIVSWGSLILALALYRVYLSHSLYIAVRGLYFVQKFNNLPEFDRCFGVITFENLLALGLKNSRKIAEILLVSN